MDEKEVGEHWEKNAAEWVRAIRSGYDLCRTYINNPAFFEMLPDVAGLRVLDVGCGGGTNTRLFAERGAKMVGVDISETMIAAAGGHERADPKGIEYHVAPGNDLSIFPDGCFDAAVSTMAMMDMADYAGAVREVARVIKAGGFFQFSICHPVTVTRIRRWIWDQHGRREGLMIGDYFGFGIAPEVGWVEEWYFGAAPEEVREKVRRFRVPTFARTLTEYFNTLVDAGMTVERIHEPFASEEVAAEVPYVASSRLVPEFLIFRCRKP